MTEHEKFVEDWKNRYLDNTCTKEHLERLKNINRLSEEEYLLIINSKGEVK